MSQDVENIVNAIPALHGASNVQALSGGITNHNYRVEVGDEVFVLRVAGENTTELGIDRGAGMPARQSPRPPASAPR